MRKFKQFVSKNKKKLVEDMTKDDLESRVAALEKQVTKVEKDEKTIAKGGKPKDTDEDDDKDDADKKDSGKASSDKKSDAPDSKSQKKSDDKDAPKAKDDGPSKADSKDDKKAPPAKVASDGKDSDDKKAAPSGLAPKSKLAPDADKGDVGDVSDDDDNGSPKDSGPVADDDSKKSSKAPSKAKADQDPDSDDDQDDDLKKDDETDDEGDQDPDADPDEKGKGDADNDDTDSGGDDDSDSDGKDKDNESDPDEEEGAEDGMDDDDEIDIGPVDGPNTMTGVPKDKIDVNPPDIIPSDSKTGETEDDEKKDTGEVPGEGKDSDDDNGSDDSESDAEDDDATKGDEDQVAGPDGKRKVSGKDADPDADDDEETDNDDDTVSVGDKDSKAVSKRHDDSGEDDDADQGADGNGASADSDGKDSSKKTLKKFSKFAGKDKKNKKPLPKEKPKAAPMKEVTKTTAVIGFGRMNPPTWGHEKVVRMIESVAKSVNGTPMLFVSHTQDGKRNPLPYADKLAYAREAFGDVVKGTEQRHLFGILGELTGKFDNVIVVVGEDRYEEFSAKVPQYNGTLFEFENVAFVKVGRFDRANISATKMRKFINEGRYQSFEDNLPKNIRYKAAEIYRKCQGNLISEKLDIHGKPLDVRPSLSSVIRNLGRK